MIKIALIDDHQIVRSGFAQLLNLEPDLQVVAEFGSASDALAGLPGSGARVCVCDISMPDQSGLDLLKQLPSGLAVVMPDLIPNSMWPGPRVAAEFRRKVTMPCGRVPVYDVRPDVLARAMDALADPAVRAGFQAESLAWAAAHSWEAQRPVWRNLLSA